MLRMPILIVLLLALLAGRVLSQETSDSPPRPAKKKLLRPERATQDSPGSVRAANATLGKDANATLNKNAVADQNPAADQNVVLDKNDLAKNPESKSPASESPDREAAVHTFVERHHPELSELLKHLKANKPKLHEKAIRDLYSVSEKLAALQHRDATRYELELKAWKVKSRIHLLSARLTMGDDDELKSRLNQALADQYDVRREFLALDKDRAYDRARKLEKDLADYDARRSTAIEKQFQQLTSSEKAKARPNAGKNKAERPGKGPAKQ